MKRRIEIWLLVVIAMMLNSCYNNDEDTKPGMPRKVDVAFTLSGTSHITRMADNVVQNGSAREIEILHAIPLIGETPDVLELINVAFVPKTNARFFYANCDLSVGVDKFRIYTRAVPSGVKAHNGSLAATFPTTGITPTTDLSTAISFSPVSIVESTTTPEGAGSLATFLSDIANASVTVSGTTHEWKNSNNTTLKKLFQNFTNKGDVIPGSAVNVRELASRLKLAINGQSFSNGTVEKAICDKIVELCDDDVTIDDVTIKDSQYPRDIDLPDGAAVLKWNGTDAFIPQTQTSTVAQINSINRYAYPPELYYYVESSLLASDTQVNFASVCPEKNTWDEVLNTKDSQNLPFFTNTSVSETTRSVAITEPVQYAVAQLKVTVRTTSETVPDGRDPVQNITIGTENFPLTGIIVSGQRQVNDAFNQTGNGDTDVKFVYDSQLKTNGSDYYYLAYSATEATEDTPGPNTLVLQSFGDENNVGEDVTIILEFENRSGALFYGVNQQIIYPDTRFYLVGTISHPTYDSTKGDYTRRVFTKDYITRVNVSVNSLAGAYNVLPNILSSNLEIGVETTPQWIAATPTTVIME